MARVFLSSVAAHAYPGRFPALAGRRQMSYIARMTTDGHPPGLAFRKMHGAGNDFVVIDSRGRGAMMTAALARAIGDRHRGVGYDQLAELHDGDGDGDADLALDFWNSDGSRAGACGNATRCVADLVMREGGRDCVAIRTSRGLLRAERRGGAIWVNMGAPLTDWRDIPLAGVQDHLHLPIEGDPVAIGMGNPHCVFFVPDAEVVALETLGPRIEHHPLFPERTNVEFASLLGDDVLRLRVWERGTGITLACGSGACAAAVAAHMRGLTGRRVDLVVDGGELRVDWGDDGVWLSGPVAHVFDAVLSPAFLAGV
ncbi:MAG: diaminopimelate epimerase DapF [Rhodobacteraceae bacterium HLUCCA12]|nr:MAG: diaminopimelate epimerase DapF [Rhodobacteraceae bacterium HLUCCA12]